MSRVAFVLAAGVLAAMASVPASAGELAVNNFGIPIAPQGGNDSVHQWGGVDDAFAVNPDGDEAPVRAQPHHPGSLAQNQDDEDQDQDDPGDPDTDHLDEVLAI